MPVQPENINFIPDKIVNERRVRKTKMIGTRVSIIFLVAVSIISGGIFYYNYTITQKIDKYKADTKQRTDEIANLKRFGEEGYKLGTRLESVYKITKGRPQGSGIMNEVSNRLPTGVDIIDWSYNPTQGLIIKGASKSTYVPIDLFKENLLSKADDGTESPFTAVKLTSASYDKSDGLVSFSINVSVDISKLTHEPAKTVVPIVNEEQNDNGFFPEPESGIQPTEPIGSTIE